MHMHFCAVYLHLSFQENQTVRFLSFHVHLCSSRNKQLHTWGWVSPQITSQLWQSWCYLWLPYSLIDDLQQFCQVKSIRNKHFSIFNPFCQKVVQRKMWLRTVFILQNDPHEKHWSMLLTLDPSPSKLQSILVNIQTIAHENSLLELLVLVFS